MIVIDESSSVPNNHHFEIYSPKIVASIVASYLIFVYQVGPRLMKNRPAYKLKHFLRLYNVLQVASCVHIIQGIWNLESWSLFDFSRCIHYLPNSAESIAFDNVMYKVYIVKIFELTDTVIFVLRKKRNQITHLHVFHHSSIITLCSVSLNYYRGNAGLFGIYLNSWIHIVMYTYYFFANICSAETIKKYILVKKSITIIQMIQFCIVLIQAASLWSICEIHPIIKSYAVIVVCVIFYGFYDFYKKAYLSKEQKTTK